MKFEYIYALQNKSFKDHCIKIGRTTREPNLRAKEIYHEATGVPEPFDVAFVCRVADCVRAEKTIHQVLNAYRSNKNREFFTTSIQVAGKVIVRICKQVNESLGCVVENPVIIDKQEIDEPDLQLEDEPENLPNVHWLSSDEFAKIVPAKPGRSSLNEQQKQRIEVIADIFSEIFPGEPDEWATDFSRDVHPEIEITVWENIAKAFVKIDQVKYLSDSQKKEAFHLLFMRSMMTASKVLEEIELKKLTRRAAKEILRGYETDPVPVRLFLHRGGR